MDAKPKLYPCTFLVPLAYNDGKPVDPAMFADIRRALDRQFGGYRVLGRQEGSWFGQVEESVAMLVAVPEERIEELRQAVKAIGKALGQKQMCFEKGNPSVELLNVG
jgi:hypothetical protein